MHAACHGPFLEATEKKTNQASTGFDENVYLSVQVITQDTQKSLVGF